MQLHGQRRVRAGWPGAADVEVVPERPKIPQPNHGRVKWRDHEVHRERGYSSFLDVVHPEVQSTSFLERLADGHRPFDECVVSLWYSEDHYQVERESVRASASAASKTDPDQYWNKLSSFVPRHYSGHRGGDHSESPSTSSSGITSPAPSGSEVMVAGGSEVRGGSRDERSPLSRAMSPASEPVGLDSFVIHGLVGEGESGTRLTWNPPALGSV